MKKLIIFLLPIFVISCKKETVASTTKQSVMETEFSEPSNKEDSAYIKISHSIDKDNEVVTNSIQNKSSKSGTIVKLVDGEHLPFTLDSEFTNKENLLIIKILKYNNPQLRASITTEQKDFNVQFNQIKLANGELDGPFSKEITYKMPKKGEVWLIIGINNRAEGKAIGKFSVLVE
ncbi:hypothetical protein [Chryseobacterium sp.]|uniref:hypothetical protein n=1 Tax=Chryseobacterium sp. TaxID=1871047 RepID=UPI00389040D3